MRGLTIIVVSPDADRFHAVMTVAAANAALDARTRIFLQGEAAALIAQARSPADEERSRCGLPTTEQIVTEAEALGAEIIICQSGLTLCGLSAEQLPESVTTSGLIQILSTLEDDRLLMA